MRWRDELTRRFPKLTRLGADAYVVGGAIRDLLLGREPADVDVACLDPLAAAKKIRDRVIRLGDEEQLSAYRVVGDDRVYDFAALLGDSLEADLARRDFTVNAMAVELANDVLHDPHGGQRDVEARLVRMVDPSNFDDDPLRILKGVRMAVKYGFDVDPATLQAIRERAPRILDVAAERVTYELSVIFSSNAANRAVALLRDTGLADALGLKVREMPSDDVTLAGAYALLVGDPRAYGERWRWSESLIHRVATLQRLMSQHDRLTLFHAGEHIARQLPPLLPGVALDMPDFDTRALLTGNEIAEILGIPGGMRVGRVKKALVEAQVRGEVKTRDEAIRFVTSSA